VTAARATPFIGLTGAVAAGKSAALDAFRRLGAATLSSDAVVHEILEDDEVRARLVDRWGVQVAPGGRLDRARIGAVVFADRVELEWLESVLHPLVGERIARWRAEVPAGVPAAVVEVPLLFESGLDGVFDATIAIVAHDEERARRAGARGTAELAGREERQLSQEEKAKRATFVVANDGTMDELEVALSELLPRISELAERAG
jgi:dephospho-CoA kinase